MRKLKTILLLLLNIVYVITNGQFASTAAPNLFGTDIGMNDFVLTKGAGMSNLNRIGHLASGTWGNTNGKWSAIGVPNIGTGIPGVQMQGTNMYGYLVNWDSDRFFCGLQDDGDQQKNAIIGWGDNFENSSIGYDKLIFKWFPTTYPTDVNTTGEDVMVMFPSKNVGIGGAFTDANQPWRRLDIFDGASPQLRLTQTQNANSTLGIYSELQTTSAGHLVVTSYNNGTNKNVGINTPTTTTPNRRLDVYDNTGVPQLRLTYSNSFFQIYTDLQTTSNGDLFIDPEVSGVAKNVGISIAAPTQKLDINGGARIRSVPANTPNSILTGVGSAGDYVVNRLDFTGNSSQVLLGNGTWGTGTSFTTANNGLIATAGLVQLGQTTCAATGSAQLTRHSYIPMNNFNLVFADAGASQTYSTNRIGVGVCSPAAKVDILRPQIGANETNPIAVKITNTDIGLPSVNNGLATALYTTCNGTNRDNYAGDFRASGGLGNRGINSIATTGSGSTNYGGYFNASGNQTNYGIYAAAPGGVAGTDYAGYFVGDVYVNGAPTSSTGYFIASDALLKRNVNVYKNAIEAISKLSVKTYEYKNEEYPEFSFSKGTQIGLIAQNMAEVFPQLTRDTRLTREDNSILKFKSVNYYGLIPVLVQAVKELNDKTEEVVSLRKEIADVKTATENAKRDLQELKVVIEDICNNGCNNFKGNVPGTQSRSMLLQNIPNPFTHATVIPYSITGTSEKAVIVISNLNGVAIKQFEISQTGSGSVEIKADELQPGTYLYSLFVNGKLSDTKEMVLIK